MIKGMHGIFFTPEPEAARTFIQEKLGFTHVDAGDGWLIFGVPQAELAIHPGSDTLHQLSFWCDDIEKTVQELEAKGVSFRTPIEDQGWGHATAFELPGGNEVMLYEPKHPQP
ncbi:MAG: extradiol dioxygenase [Dehalococcoidia bacterium]|nr:extradiol dioxygenase [Dehalococcoidia bacterium]